MSTPIQKLLASESQCGSRPTSRSPITILVVPKNNIRNSATVRGSLSASATPLRLVTRREGANFRHKYREQKARKTTTKPRVLRRSNRAFLRSVSARLNSTMSTTATHSRIEPTAKSFLQYAIADEITCTFYKQLCRAGLVNAGENGAKV